MIRIIILSILMLASDLGAESVNSHSQPFNECKACDELISKFGHTRDFQTCDYCKDIIQANQPSVFQEVSWNCLLGTAAGIFFGKNIMGGIVGGCIGICTGIYDYKEKEKRSQNDKIQQGQHHQSQIQQFLFFHNAIQTHDPILNQNPFPDALKENEETPKQPKLLEL